MPRARPVAALPTGSQAERRIPALLRGPAGAHHQLPFGGILALADGTVLRVPPREVTAAVAA